MSSIRNRTAWILGFGFAAIVGVVACAADDEGEDFGGTGGASTGGTGGSATGGTGATPGTGGTRPGSGGTTPGTGGTTPGTGGTTPGTGGTAGTGGGAGGVGGQGGASTCTIQEAEPNNTEAAPQALGDYSCKDNEGCQIEGNLSGPGDEDWYQFHGEDTITCFVNPEFTFAWTATGNATICAYFLCDNDPDPAETTVDCGGNATVATSAASLPGCCTTEALLEATPDCTGITDNDSTNVYISVTNSPSASAEDYTLDFHY